MKDSSMRPNGSASTCFTYFARMLRCNCLARTFLVVSCFSGIATGEDVAAASFDCSLVSDQEYTICHDTELSLLDEQLAKSYALATKQSPNGSRIRAEQRRWLNEVRSACRLDTDCLKDVYKKRIQELDLVNTNKVAGSYECQDGERTKTGGLGLYEYVTEGVSVIFKLNGGLVTEFSSLWTRYSDSPDLRSPYQPICSAELSEFEHFDNPNFILLKSRSDFGSRGVCELHIFESAKFIHIYSFGCSNDCLNLELNLPKDGKACRKLQVKQ